MHMNTYLDMFTNISMYMGTQAHKCLCSHMHAPKQTLRNITHMTLISTCMAHRKTKTIHSCWSSAYEPSGTMRVGKCGTMNGQYKVGVYTETGLCGNRAEPIHHPPLPPNLVPYGEDVLAQSTDVSTVMDSSPTSMVTQF